ncbi:hypothetical protein D3C87_1878610 [compost metagenome]
MGVIEKVATGHDNELMWIEQSRFTGGDMQVAYAPDFLFESMRVNRFQVFSRL